MKNENALSCLIKESIFSLILFWRTDPRHNYCKINWRTFCILLEMFKSFIEDKLRSGFAKATEQQVEFELYYLTINSQEIRTGMVMGFLKC